MKKGSLSLSMNAIVILILAITLLGLGLSFMRGLFKQMETKVGIAISAQELTNPPTTDNPLTMAPSKLTLREGESGEVLVAFMNVLPEDATCKLEICEPGGGNNCIDTGVCSQDDCTLTVNYNNLWYDVRKDQINSYTLAISAESDDAGASGTTYLYTANMCCDTSSPRDQTCDDTGDGSFNKDLVVVVKP